MGFLAAVTVFQLVWHCGLNVVSESFHLFLLQCGLFYNIKFICLCCACAPLRVLCIASNPSRDFKRIAGNIFSFSHTPVRSPNV